MLLKNGSKGNDVKVLQEFLGIPADGIFGPNTESGVREWQKNNGLTADGIVGPLTWNAMGLATTDNTEKIYTTPNNLVIHEHFLPAGQYFEGPTPKDYLFLHHTAGWDNPYNTIDFWGREEHRTVATEFVIGGQSIRGNNDNYDGETVQVFPEGSYAWHLGHNGSSFMHSHSVGIEMCNFGYLVNGKTYVDTKAATSQIATLDNKFRTHKTWHKYSDNQIKNLKKLILHIADRDNIDVKKGLVEEINKNGPKGFDYNEDAFFGRVKGMWTHTNTRKDKFDMFPQAELLDMLVSL